MARPTRRRKKPTAQEVTEHRAKAPEALLARQRKYLLPGGPKVGHVTLTPFQFQTSIFEGSRGRLEAIDNSFGRAVSSDGGKTWKGYAVMKEFRARRRGHQTNSAYANGWICLPSGRIGLSWSERGTVAGGHSFVRLWWRTSDDGGRTWSKDVPINPTGWPGEPYFDALRLTSKGRLLLPVRHCFSAGQTAYDTAAKGAGWYKGKKDLIEGHGHFPEMDITFVYFSDDEGKTWARCEGELLGWPYNGWGNYVACDEPNLEETRDGKLLMLMRTTIGRLLAAWSSDQGLHWTIPAPTMLASSYSPCALKRIPSTSDLLCVWNQVSSDEIRLGYRRGRLSVAISTDGERWFCCKTLERHGILEERSYVPPEEKLQLARALSDVGELHTDWGVSDYATIAFHGEDVLLGYVQLKGRGTGMVSSHKLRVIPLDWFYQE
ncbi:MAG: sialidase family protein [Planctomycetota bacterium]